MIFEPSKPHPTIVALLPADIVGLLYEEFIWPAEEWEMKESLVQRIKFRMWICPYVYPIWLFHVTHPGRKTYKAMFFGTFASTNGAREYYIKDGEPRVKQRLISAIWEESSESWKTMNTYMTDHPVWGVGGTGPDAIDL